MFTKVILSNLDEPCKEMEKMYGKMTEDWKKNKGKEVILGTPIEASKFHLKVPCNTTHLWPIIGPPEVLYSPRHFWICRHCFIAGD